ncbi:hypothetical protein [Dickeya chrysanthemi]|uniref:hypothetical protein n=1 Tax=Dickeya chrysanthemi TaxID=556 RepID=UPI0004816BA5|nr:hypothetical protein [Dickeya chrysanthemi]
MSILYISLISIVPIFIIMKIIDFRKTRKNVAYNILLSQITYNNESIESKKIIDGVAREILKSRTTENMMTSTFNEDNPLVIYGFYALAMQELNIAPSSENFKNWFPVRNPFIGETNIQKYLRKAKIKIEKKDKKKYNLTIGK